jgi:hypothetical protein
MPNTQPLSLVQLVDGVTRMSERWSKPCPASAA